MGIYAIATMSGSAGKSTSASTLAVKVAQQGRRVRLIDFDAQANATTWCGITKLAPKQHTVADVIAGGATLKEASVAVEGVPGLFVVPAKRNGLDRVAVELNSETGAEFRLHEAMLRAADDGIDHTIIDCAGSLTVLVIAAILATQADVDDDESIGRSGVITCTQPMLKENEGIPELVDEIQKINKVYRRAVELLGIIPCIVPSARDGEIYLEQLESVLEAFPTKATPSVRRTSIVPDAYAKFTPLPLFGHRAKGVNSDYDAVLSHLQKAQCLI